MSRFATNSSQNKSVIEQALQSNALMAVIIGRIVIALALAGVAVAALYFGVQMVLPSEPTQADNMILTYKEFSMSAQGLGAVIMMSGVALGILAFLCRPKLDIKPINNSRSRNIFRNNSNSEEVIDDSINHKDESIREDDLNIKEVNISEIKKFDLIESDEKIDKAA